jgi:thioredoxin 1
MQNFNDIINSEQPTLVDFFTEWCGPCKAMAPILKNVAEKSKGKARIIKVDLDKNPAVSSRYTIQAVPTLILFKKGEILWRQPGLVPEEDLIDVITKFSA